MTPILSLLLQVHRLADNGPVYYETNLENLVVEPWNAVTAILFLLIVGYWAFRVWTVRKSHLFLVYMLPILAIGGIGGTIYHAFRYSRVFLVMDWLPIMLLSFAAGIYFMVKSTGRWWYALLVIAGVAGLQTLNFTLMPERLIHIAISISYGLLGMVILVPTIFYMIKTKWVKSRIVLYALISFFLALIFRLTDMEGWLPMGTHFLWHTFGALAANFMFAYIFLTREWEIQQENG